eukprot:s1549_g18.t1
MVRVDWSAWGFAYYCAFAILYSDLLQVIIGVIFWRQFRKYRRKFAATRQEEQKNHRKEYLKSLPRRNWHDLEPRTPPHEAAVPEESRANIQNEHTCIFCLTEYTPTCTVVKLDCGHIFHESCIPNWILDEKREPCPFRCPDFPAELVARARDNVDLRPPSTAPAIMGRRSEGLERCYFR